MIFRLDSGRKWARNQNCVYVHSLEQFSTPMCTPRLLQCLAMYKMQINRDYRFREQQLKSSSAQTRRCVTNRRMLCTYAFAEYPECSSYSAHWCGWMRRWASRNTLTSTTTEAILYSAYLIDNESCTVLCTVFHSTHTHSIRITASKMLLRGAGYMSPLVPLMQLLLLALLWKLIHSLWNTFCRPNATKKTLCTASKHRQNINYHQLSPPISWNFHFIHCLALVVW